MENTMHDRRKFLGTIGASVGAFFLPLPREVLLVKITAGPEDRNVVDVLGSDPRAKFDESRGRIAGTYLARFGEWQTELDNALWGFCIRRNGQLVLGDPLAKQKVSPGDIISVGIRFT